MSRKMLFAVVGLALLLTGFLAMKVDAAMLPGVGSPPPIVHSYSPVEPVRCVCGPRGCACGPAWRSGWGWGPRRCWWRRGVRVCRW